MNLFYLLLSLLLGATAILQTGINSQLRQAAGSPTFASLINFTVGGLSLLLLFCLRLALHTETLPAGSALRQTSWWMWTGGLIGAATVFFNSFVPAKIGFANFFCLMIAGQLAASVLFDHFGLMGNATHPVNLPRLLGVGCLILGAVLIQKN